MNCLENYKIRKDKMIIFSFHFNNHCFIKHSYAYICIFLNTQKNPAFS